MTTSGRQFEQLSYVPLGSVAIKGESKGLGCATTRCAPLVQVPSVPPTRTVYTHIFEMWIGSLSTHRGLAIPVL